MMDWVILVVVVVGLLWGIWGRGEVLKGLQDVGNRCLRIEAKQDMALDAQMTMIKALSRYRLLGKCKVCGLQFVTDKPNGNYKESACCSCELLEDKDE